MNRNTRLLIGVLAYALLNGIGVFLAASGIIHPPWGILDFFTFIGPIAGSVAIVWVHLFVARLTPLVLIGVLALLLVAALLNWQCYLAAMAVV
jgi:hypothetical protein